MNPSDGPGDDKEPNTESILGVCWTLRFLVSDPLDIFTVQYSAVQCRAV